MVVGFVMAPEEDKCLADNERAVLDGIFPIKRGGENAQPPANGRGEQGDSIRPATKISCLENVVVWDGILRVQESISKVVKVAHIDRRHIDIYVSQAVWSPQDPQHAYYFKSTKPPNTIKVWTSYYKLRITKQCLKETSVHQQTVLLVVLKVMFESIIP
jgi:hypothetical protein